MTDDGVKVRVIVGVEAKNARPIFDLYLRGYGALAIVRALQRRGIIASTGKEVWPKGSIETILQNERHIGDVLACKTCCNVYPSKICIGNDGSQDQVFVSDHHSATFLSFAFHFQFCSHSPQPIYFRKILADMKRREWVSRVAFMLK